MDVPAVCGLRNQGNTCFVNAVIQCLSNAELFSEYFVGDFYKIDRKKHCKINSRHKATKGEVTEQLANLLKCLWSLRSHSDAAIKFKHVISRYGPQFGDSAQHDAQEFLLWLLDTVHEDLNLVSRKHAVGGRQPDNGPHNSSLADHLRYNNSFIHDLVQSQVRSSLTCICGRQSSTVDPLLCFSIPIPSSPLCTILVKVSFFQRIPRRSELSVSVDTRGTVRELRDRISRQTRILEKRLVLMRCDSQSAVSELADDRLSIQQSLCDVQVIHAVETSPPQREGTDIVDLVIVNRCQKQVFGPLFQSCTSRSASFRKLQLELLQSLTPYLNHSLNLKSLASDDFCLRIVVDSHESDQLPIDVDHPLYIPIVDEAISRCEEKKYRGPVHLNLVLDWDPKIKQSVFADSPALSPTAPISSATVSVYDCLDLYFREEKLQDENAWLCPSCHKRTASTKKLSLWTLPDLLIIHLKRFRQSQTIRSKILTAVTFPLSELDLSPYVDDRNEGRSGCQNTLSRLGNRLPSSTLSRVRSRSLGRDSNSLPTRFLQPWKRPALRWSRLDPASDSRCSTYDLVAVCNHTGSLLSGHYTATCRNPVNLQWYHFDDSAVTPVKDMEVYSPNAYLLFYQRCSLSPTSSCDSAYLSSTSHDSRRLNWHKQTSSSRDLVSTRQSPTFDYALESRDMRWSRSREDVRGSFPYATIPPAKTGRSICNLLFRKKGRGCSSSRDRRKAAPIQERRIQPEGRALTVILPPEESCGRRKSDKSESPDQQSDEKTHEDKHFCTVTSV